MTHNRRQFLKLLGAGAALVPCCGRLAFADTLPPERDGNFVVLLADTHIGPSQYQCDALSQRISEILAMRPLPTAVVIYGDMAYDAGVVSDYLRLRQLLKPLDDAGVTWVPVFGNHDRRDPFFEVFPDRATTFVPGRLVNILETPRCDFILLDSLVPGKVPGAVDDAQRDWLRETLRTRTRPVLVGAHHGLNETLVAEVMKTAPVPTAYIHGHHHHWRCTEFEGVQSLTLPSTGHWGDIGLVTLRTTDAAAACRLTMRDYYRPRPLPEPKPEWLENVQKLQGAEWTWSWK